MLRGDHWMSFRGAKWHGTTLSLTINSYVPNPDDIVDGVCYSMYFWFSKTLYHCHNMSDMMFRDTPSESLSSLSYNPHKRTCCWHISLWSKMVPTQQTIGSRAFLNSLWPSDTIWWHSFGSTLAQLIVCCLMVPSHHRNQCWLIMRGVLRHSLESNFTRSIL